MGVTIHYRGRLNDVGQIGRLCDELADIAAAMGWESTRLDDDWEQPADARLQHTSAGAKIVGNLGLKGIWIKPDVEVESLRFCFDRDGNLRCPVGMVSILDGTLKPEDAWVFVKTQFGPPQIHVWIIGLLKYLKKHYIADLQVSDEGEYWETGDIRILSKRMDFLNKKIEQIAGKLSSTRLGDASNLSPDEIVARIEKLLRGEDFETFVVRGPE
jgi:hypothetical protein